MNRLFFYVTVLLTTAIIISAYGQRTITGRLVDKETGKPVKDALITNVGTETKTTSNALGFFQLEVDSTSTIEIVSSGYPTMHVEVPEVNSFKIELVKPPVANKLLDVYEEPASFPEKMQKFYDYVNKNINSPDAQEVFTFKPGVYLTFDDFLNNSPSKVDSFRVVTETEQTISRMRYTSGDGVNGIQGILSVYRLKDKNGKKLKGSADFWGFSDGHFIYINSNTHTKADHFVRLQIVGPICYFFQLGDESGLKKSEYRDPGDIRQRYPTMHPKIYYLEQFVFEIKTGQIFKLTKDKLLQIVSRYSDLAETSRGLNKKDTFIDIIRLYNFKMKSEQN